MGYESGKGINGTEGCTEKKDTKRIGKRIDRAKELTKSKDQ